MSAYGFADDLHRVLERFDALRQVVNYFVLRLESLVHLVLKLLAELHKFDHGVALELFDILVLLLQLTGAVVFEGSELERFVRSLSVNLLLQVVFGVVDLLHDVLLALDTSCYFAIELVLESYTPIKNMNQSGQAPV